jgi:hypothetical protein
VIDTTGSMGGLLEGAKQKIWNIVNEVMQRRSQPRVRVGLVAYRDRSDAYETQILPLTEDLDKVYETLTDYRAEGGGDMPENVRRALSEGVKNAKNAGWSKPRPGLAQIIFLVGDAPPQNYGNEPDVLATVVEAASKNMIVNTIQCGDSAETREIWLAVARRGQGSYFAIAQDGGVRTISTPYDEKLADLGRQMGDTYLAYGANREEMSDKQALTESSVANTNSTTARADRALNKAINKDAYNGDLLQDIEKGKVDPESVKKEELPDNLQRMTEEDRRQEIERRLAERKKIRDEILNLSKQRETFISAENKKSGKRNGFDSAVRSALDRQLQSKGIQ